MLGALPGINQDGSTTADMKTLVDGLKVTNKYEGKVHYWNWNFAPMDGSHCKGPAKHQYLTEDFLFMPENWGPGPIDLSKVIPAGSTNFTDVSGVTSPAKMADVLLGTNEPDIIGSCQGDQMGKCMGPCKPGEVCPSAHICGKQGAGTPNAQGHCDCWSDDTATSAGFWGIAGVSGYQPLPTCFENEDCIDYLIGSFVTTAMGAVSKGYKYATSPLVAENMNWTRSFLQHACAKCTDLSCGCPTHIAWHFYAYDCQPEKYGYKDFQMKLDATLEMMEEFPHLQGALVNEVGMLNCAPGGPCLPNAPNQTYPGSSQPGHTCPATKSLPKGMGSFVEQLLEMVGKAKTKDGRRAVVSFTWFAEEMTGGTYDMRLFDDKGSLNELAKSYISGCQAWAKDVPPGPAPGPTPPSPPSPPTPTPPTPAPKPGPTPGPAPSKKCNIGDSVHCPGAAATQMCGGNQCCPDGSTCPSASETFQSCPKPKEVDCTKSAIIV
jgi:hypothetical protein